MNVNYYYYDKFKNHKTYFIILIEPEKNQMSHYGNHYGDHNDKNSDDHPYNSIQDVSWK